MNRVVGYWTKSGMAFVRFPQSGVDRGKYHQTGSACRKVHWEELACYIARHSTIIRPWETGQIHLMIRIMKTRILTLACVVFRRDIGIHH